MKKTLLIAIAISIFSSLASASLTKKETKLFKAAMIHSIALYKMKGELTPKEQKKFDYINDLYDGKRNFTNNETFYEAINKYKKYIQKYFLHKPEFKDRAIQAIKTIDKYLPTRYKK